MVDAPVLLVSNLSKEYKIYPSPVDRLKSLLSKKTHYKSHLALDGVTFSLRRGQCLGIIGDNGAGKSSLLKLIAGTLQPSAGAVEKNGRVTAILELGAGFHPEFSGRENLHFAGSLMGFSSQDLSGLEDAVIRFADLGEAIDRPLKTYSSGMVVRLAFGLVTAVMPELLIVDEALAVGDQSFQKKCTDRIDEFRRQGCSILFCSHSLYHVRQICDLALWLEKGRVKAFGETESVLASYESHVREQLNEKTDQLTTTNTTRPNANTKSRKAISGTVNRITSVQVADLGVGNPPLLQSKNLLITVTVEIQKEEIPSIGLMLEQLHGVGVTSVASHADNVKPIAIDHGVWKISLTFPDLPLHTGEYVISAYLFDGQGLVVYDEWLHCQKFKYIYPSLTPGLVRLPHYWS
jgi:lipopolysaccharide transport system ATP-binding protein